MAGIVAGDRVPFLLDFRWRQLDPQRRNACRLPFYFHFHLRSDVTGAAQTAQTLGLKDLLSADVNRMRL
jgi:hypothetical protein